MYNLPSPLVERGPMSEVRSEVGVYVGEQCWLLFVDRSIHAYRYFLKKYDNVPKSSSSSICSYSKSTEILNPPQPRIRRFSGYLRAREGEDPPPTGSSPPSTSFYNYRSTGFIHSCSDSTHHHCLQIRSCGDSTLQKTLPTYSFSFVSDSTSIILHIHSFGDPTLQNTVIFTHSTPLNSQPLYLSLQWFHTRWNTLSLYSLLQWFHTTGYPIYIFTLVMIPTKILYLYVSALVTIPFQAHTKYSI